MTTQVGGNQINSSGGLTFTTTTGVVANHDTLGNIVNSQRPWFKSHSDSAGNGSPTTWTNYNNARLTKAGQQGNCFDLSTGRFTAPIAGLYQFNISHITHSSSGDTRVALYVNGGYNFRRSIVVSTQAPHHNNANQGHCVYLGAGDYVEAANHSGSGTHSNDWNHFSGYYVGEYN